MRVLGIDPSLTATGVATPKGDLYVVGGPARHGDTRLAFIHQEIEHVCQRQRPDLAVVEGPFVHQLNNTITLGMVHGIVRLALVRERVPFAVVPPATLKKYATGNGTADKDGMRLALRMRAGVDERDNNLVDAWWLRHAGLDRLGEQIVQLPANQRACLDVVDWPAIAED